MGFYPTTVPIEGQYRASQFGMVNDGVRLTDAVTTSGSPTVTSAGASFSASDVGKAVCLYSGTHQNFACDFTNADATVTCASTANLIAGMHVSGCQTVITTGTITSGSTTISVLGTTTGLVVGMVVSGNGIAGGTVIDSINTGASTMVISIAANGTGSGVALTFAKQIVPLDATIASITDATHFELSANATATLTGLATDFVPDWIVTTISGVNSGTSIALADNAVKTDTGVRMLYGTDNTAALQAAYDALDAIGGVIQCNGSTTAGGGFYMLAGALLDTGVRNSVVKVPNRDTGQIVEITLQGAGPVALMSNGFLGGYPPSMNGTVFFCPTKASGTTPAIFSGNNVGGLSCVIAAFLNVTLLVPQCSGTCALSFLNGGGLLVDQCVLDVEFGLYSEFLLHAYPTVSYGVIYPNSNNGGACQFHESRIGGYGTAIYGSQHLTVAHSTIATCAVGVAVRSGEVIIDHCHFVGVGVNFKCPTGQTGIFRISSCVENQAFGPFVNTWDVQDVDGTGLYGKAELTLLNNPQPKISTANVECDYLTPLSREVINPPVYILADAQRLVFRQLNSGSTIGLSIQGIDGTVVGQTFGLTAFGGQYVTQGGTGITVYVRNASALGLSIDPTTGDIAAPNFP